jgi:hypothetical protein
VGGQLLAPNRVLSTGIGGGIKLPQVLNLHCLTPLPQGKQVSDTHCIGDGGEEKNLCPCREMSLDSPVVQSVGKSLY